MRTFLIIVIAFTIFFPNATHAATKSSATPSATPISKEIKEKIDDLKERLATKVEELRRTSPKAIHGTITNISLSSATIDTGQKAYKIELTDNIVVTQIIKGKRTKSKIDTLKKDDAVTIFGTYDETLDILQAKHIVIESKQQPKRLHGTIAEINKKDNSFTMKCIDGTIYTIDVETTTKNNSWLPGKEIQKSGFSKLEQNIFVTVLGIEQKRQPDRYIAARILTWKSQTGNSSQEQELTPTQAITPSPTNRVSPTPRRSPTPTPTRPKASPTAP